MPTLSFRPLKVAAQGILSLPSYAERIIPFLKSIDLTLQCGLLLRFDAEKRNKSLAFANSTPATFRCQVGPDVSGLIQYPKWIAREPSIMFFDLSAARFVSWMLFSA